MNNGRWESVCVVERFSNNPNGRGLGLAGRGGVGTPPRHGHIACGERGLTGTG